MFSVTLKSGKTLTEGKDINSFDEIPSNEYITSAQLFHPYSVNKMIGNTFLKRNAVVNIGRFDRYYISKVAIANMMSFGGGSTGGMGEGQVIGELLCGIDDVLGETICIKLNLASGNVTVDKFNTEAWIKRDGINPLSFKKGVPRDK